MSAESVPTPWSRSIGVGVGLAALVALVLLAFAWPAVTSEPRDLPLAVAGPAPAVAAVQDALDENAPGVFVPVEAADRDEAVRLIEERRVYGAIVLGEKPELLSASAASPIVAQQLGILATGLGARLTEAAQAQAPDGVDVPPVVVTVTDVVPLVDDDPRGAGLVAAIFPLVIGGVAGGAAIALAIVGRGRRILALLVEAVVAGPALAAILQLWFGVLPGSYLLNATVLGLGVLAIAAPIVGLAALLGRAGVGLGALTMILVANPISAAAQPVEFLPVPWGAVGQWFPPGASATLIRDVAYFPAADPLFPWLVLTVWATAGVLLTLLGRKAIVESRESQATRR
jgi:hypothetical protein